MSVAEQLEPISRLSRDLRAATATLSVPEVRYLVDYYYQLQDFRKSSDNQVRSMDEEPHEVLAWFAGSTRSLEGSIQRALDRYTDSNPVGQWSKSIVGIGPVIAAGLLAHIDIEQAPTVGHIWRFAGLDPTVSWEKKTKRPWNAELKTLCWKIGESFVKVSNNEADIYGHIYANRKELESLRNAEGMFADQAEAKLAKFKIDRSTDAYKAYSTGKLPPAHIHARAKRYAVKLFLAHWHHVAFEVRYGCPPPKPYILTQEGHAHYVAPPGWPM